MAGCSVHRTRGPNDARGIALVVALLVMGLLTLLGATYLTVASTEHTIASNEVSVAKAFNIAEAGLERAKPRIMDGTVTNLDDFLPTHTPGPNLFTNTSFDGGTYSVVVSDNNDEVSPILDNPNDDKDGKVFITSTGTYGNTQKRIVALVEVVLGSSGAPPIPAPRGAAEGLTGTGKSWELHADPGGSYDGRDWTAPANIASCTDIDNCGTKISDTGTYGAFANTTAGTFDVSGTPPNEGTMWGTGCTSGACGTSPGASSHTTDTSIPLTRWDSFIDAAKLAADRTLTVTGGAWNAGTVTWGTAAAPEITVINNATDIFWSTVVNGAGVLIIESTNVDAGLEFQATGQLNWQGLVIHRCPGQCGLGIANSGARVRVFGQVVNRAPQKAEIQLNGGGDASFIKYSSAAMNTVVPQAFGSPPSYTVRNWREAAIQ